MLADVVNHLGAQISGRPGADKKIRSAPQAKIRGSQKFPRARSGSIERAIQCSQPTAKFTRSIEPRLNAEDEGADHPEALFEFEFRGAHMEIELRGGGVPPAHRAGRRPALLGFFALFKTCDHAEILQRGGVASHVAAAGEFAEQAAHDFPAAGLR
jgi:hypothetical protein